MENEYSPESLAKLAKLAKLAIQRGIEYDNTSEIDQNKPLDSLNSQPLELNEKNMNSCPANDEKNIAENTYPERLTIGNDKSDLEIKPDKKMIIEWLQTKADNQNVTKKNPEALDQEEDESSVFGDVDVSFVRVYSEILEESFILYGDGTVTFDSGVEYTEEEWRRLVGLSHNELRAVHNTKEVFPESKVIERRYHGNRV